MRVAVIVAARDVAPFIGDALGSVLGQSHEALKLILVDDGSTDGTAAVAARFADPRLSILSQANAGVSAARNRGAAIAAADEPDALLFLDGDDWLAPDALARLIAGLVAAPRAVAAHAPFAFLAESATPAEPGRADRRALPRAPNLLPCLIPGNLFANGGHLLIRADTWARVGGFREDLRFGEDWEAWTRLALAGPFAAVGGPAALFVRRRAGSAMATGATTAAAYGPALAAIAANAAIADRLGARHFARLIRRAEAESAWAQGRALLRQGAARPALPLLLRGLVGRPRPQRALILAQALGGAISEMAFRRGP